MAAPVDPAAVPRRSIVLAASLTACGGQSERARDVVAPCLAAPAAVSGQATYYDADGRGRCSFDASPGDFLVAAISSAGDDGAGRCGACLAVTGPRGAVVVRVVDRCHGCAPGDLDLSRTAFAAIAPLAAGRVPITWREVACDVAGPIRYRFKKGSSPFWAALQIRNHRHSIASLAVRAPDGTWRTLPRTVDNYFVATRPGLGPGPYALRVTDQRGQVLEDPAIPLVDRADHPGAAQLAPCP